MRNWIVPAIVVSLLVPALAHAQTTDERVERVRAERRTARDVAFGSLILGGIGLIVGGSMLAVTVADEPQLSTRPYDPFSCASSACPSPAEVYADARARWETQLVASAITSAAGLSAIVVGAIVLTIVPRPGEPVVIEARLGPGSLTLTGSF